MHLKRSVRQLVVGTPAERPARSLWHTMTWRSRARGAAIRQKNAHYDELTLAVMRKVLTSNSNCVDAGAHHGSIVRHMVELAPDGVHHAFEPLPWLAQTLERRFPTVAVHHLALSDHTGEAPFRHVVDAPSNSGFERRPWDRYDEASVEIISVPVGRLDDVLPTNFKVDFLKIDVEGSELQLLRGASRVLTTDRPTVVVEVGLHAEAVYGELVKCGLRVFTLDDWLEGRSALEANDFARALTSDWYFLAHV